MSQLYAKTTEQKNLCTAAVYPERIYILRRTLSSQYRFTFQPSLFQFLGMYSLHLQTLLENLFIYLFENIFDCLDMLEKCL